MSYYQQQGMQLPRVTLVNKWIVIAAVATFILQNILALIFKFDLSMFLGLTLNGVSIGLIHQLITYPFVGTGLFEVVFSSLLVWFLGGELEQLWGVRRYLKLLALTTILTGILYLGIIVLFFEGHGGFPLFGMNCLANVLILAYALVYPDREFLFAFIFPVKAKYFCMILAGMELMMGLFSQSGVVSLGHLSAFVVAYLFIRFTDLAATISIPFGKISLGNSRRAKGNAKLRIVKSDDHITLERDKPDKNNPKFWQ
jgi:membrane associated rhomboid family serine protease